jgi:hypothetical protein
MGAIKAGSRSSLGVTNARKVPACGEVVNDGLHTARRVPGQPIRPRPGTGLRPNFTPGMVRIPTNRRSFLVYQNGPADITIAGAATES